MGLAALAEAGDCRDRLQPLVSRFSEGKWQKYCGWVDYLMTPRADAFRATDSGRRLQQLVRDYSAPQLAAAAQEVWEESLCSFVDYLRRTYGVPHFILGGGVFLNVRINTRIAQMEGIEGVYIHPHPGDGSTAVGAALEAYRSAGGEIAHRSIADSGLGLSFSEAAVEQTLRRFRGVLVEKTPDPADYAARRLAQGAVVGWFQGREEFGPRALGHRCLLGSPRPDIKERLTLAKGREAWIPIAPAVLAEHASDYFEGSPDPFMMRLCRVRPTKKPLIAAALHTDGTARLQAVTSDAFPPFRRLLERFYQTTGLPLILSTSLNRHGEPIVHRPEEAVELLLKNVMDELIIESFVVKNADSRYNAANRPIHS